MTQPDAEHPRPVDPAFSRALQRRTQRKQAAFTPLHSPFVGADAAAAQLVRDGAAAADADVVALSRRIHAHPEEAWQEHGSVAAIADLLGRHGVRPTVGWSDVATAFRAGLTAHGVDDGASDPDRAVPAGPTIAVLAEYDALPGVGHACGHNIIAASVVGAFLALVATVRGGARFPGRVLLLGTPAEEGNSGKEVLARTGFFAGVDAAIMVHPFGYDVVDQPFLGRRQLRVTYHGVAAHASASPFLGRNALDAVVLNYQAVGLLRQYLPPSDRVHGVVVDGGTRPSVVTERATVEYYVRSADPETLRDLSDRLADLARGVALATGTRAELSWDPLPFTLPVRTNGPLAARWAQHQADRGRTATAGGVVPEILAASTDFGNISQRIPGIHPMIAVGPPDVALHTREFTGFAGGPAGDAAARDAAVGLALTALDWLSDPALREAVQRDFDEAGGVIDVEGYFG
ncbi:M20 family metallopeptidase [Nakamurella leprariae]|uniref:Peptidase M20 domain-containing protein 2 n=1 Tax=Nakamurella leprariae TaxID=2803911 RepID=A0A939BY01_9ACTN|nr:M20 family metallopeptidase [Nakamurella leprariae]MBM9466106.1 M20 family metallopeptidase [Nakamurella leprariae]